MGKEVRGEEVRDEVRVRGEGGGERGKWRRWEEER